MPSQTDKVMKKFRWERRKYKTLRLGTVGRAVHTSTLTCHYRSVDRVDVDFKLLKMKSAAKLTTNFHNIEFKSRFRSIVFLRPKLRSEICVF